MNDREYALAHDDDGDWYVVEVLSTGGLRRVDGPHNTEREAAAYFAWNVNGILGTRRFSQAIV